MPFLQKQTSPLSPPTQSAAQVAVGLVSLAATALVGVCLLTLPANREAFSSYVSKQLHNATARRA